MLLVRLVLLAAIGLLPAACANDREPAAPSSATPSAEPSAQLLEQVRRKGHLRVIVTLAVQVTPEGNLPDQRAVREQRQAIATAQTDLLDDLRAYAVRDPQRFVSSPLLVLVVDEPALRHLLASPRVAAIQEDIAEPPATEAPSG
ncbi:hypothetical protein OG394_22065 [Kribbella sp. NBC_01245]|uniref:hypothetical protein n=1 Tax=Kribbella sp. NBC_01245 TaxID=2903578 RepID=UPI002E2BC572|nr:hypothetical protein [Kribbella sp. NBC_01245]